MAKADKKFLEEEDAFKKLRDALEAGKPARPVELTDEEQALVKDAFLLTSKKILYVCNISEDDIENPENDYVKKVREYAKANSSEVFVICAQIEQEIAELDDDEKAMFLEDLGLKESGLDKLIAASYDLLGLLSFLTTGEDETRAWTIQIGTKAPVAAGKIHSDMQRGFIKAEVVNYQDLLDCGSYAAARDKGLIRQEGKEYVVQDGDVILFRFNQWSQFVFYVESVFICQRFIIYRISILFHCLQMLPHCKVLPIQCLVFLQHILYQCFTEGHQRFSLISQIL